MSDSPPKLQDDVSEPIISRKDKKDKKDIKQPDVNPNDPYNKLRWKNRRRMAWTSLIGMILMTIMLLFAPIKVERLKVISEPITWFYFCSASVIGAYMGFTTWASKR